MAERWRRVRTYEARQGQRARRTAGICASNEEAAQIIIRDPARDPAGSRRGMGTNGVEVVTEHGGIVRLRYGRYRNWNLGCAPRYANGRGARAQGAAVAQRHPGARSIATIVNRNTTTISETSSARSVSFIGEILPEVSVERNANQVQYRLLQDIPKTY